MPRHCTNCGARLGDGFAFCGQCGVQVTPTERPGYLDGEHYTAYVETVALMRADELESAERLLLRLVEAVEAQHAADGFGIAPWYSERLAVLYRKRKDFAAEVMILERFGSRFKGTPYANHFEKRLTKARLLRDKS